MRFAPPFLHAKRIGSALAILAIWSFSPISAASEDAPDPLASSINGLGLDLYRAIAAERDGNILLSPFSIEIGLAMAWSGADGDTRAEMQRVLRLPSDDKSAAKQFRDLAKELDLIFANSKERAKFSKQEREYRFGAELSVANRLFVQKDFALRKPFVSQLANRSFFNAPLEKLDFRRQSENARERINSWLAQQTSGKIKDIIPSGGVNDATRLVLANAVYFHASWFNEFLAEETAPAKYLVNGKTPVDVPTMKQREPHGYAKIRDFTAVRMNFSMRGLYFLILLPDAPDGLPKLEKEITPGMLDEVAREISVGRGKDPYPEVELYLPKFRIESPTVPLASLLQKLGMKTAFDEPPGSANFDRMAPRKPDDYLSLGEVFHKTYLSLDEKGVEAAAGMMGVVYGITAPEPIVVRVDRPFLFAIQHGETCLFLGRVTDPR